MKSETEKMATRLAKTLSLLSAFAPNGRYEALVLAGRLLEKNGYASVARVAEAAASYQRTCA